MKKYFSIGETAKINNVSIQALRLYDKMGLLKPAYVDQESKYRYYTIDQFIYLDLIKYSKYIENKIKYAAEIKETNEIYYKKIEKRNIINAELHKKDQEIDVEIKIRELDKILDENEIVFEGETGCFICLDAFLNESKIFYENLYLTLCVDDMKNKSIDIKEIPGGNFICIAYSNNERQRSVEKLRKYIEENNIHYKGTGVEIQLFNTLEQWQNDTSLYELQILI